MKHCTLYISIAERQKVTEVIGRAFHDKTVEVSADGQT